MIRRLILPLAALNILFASVPVTAAVTSCTTTISDKNIDGDLVVPAGKTCDLEGVTVFGNIHVGKGAYFFANYFSSATTSIFGNFQAIQCNFAILRATGPAFVSGNVVIEGCTGPSFSSVYGTISGNLQCSGNSVGCSAQGSTIGGNAQFDNNGGLEVGNNYIGGNLQCVGNAPSGIFATGGNTVAGNNRGQCAGPSQ